MEVLQRHQPLVGVTPPVMVRPSFSLPTSMFNVPTIYNQTYGLYIPADSAERCELTLLKISPQDSSSLKTSELRDDIHVNVEQRSTLQCVLRGEVPEAYSHFLSSQHGFPIAGQRLSSSVKRRSPFNGDDQYPLLTAPTSNAILVSPSSEDLQTEPMDLSCKRLSQASGVIYSSSLGLVNGLQSSSADDQVVQNGEFSLLRNLLQVGKVKTPMTITHSTQSSSLHSPLAGSASSLSTSSANSDRSCDSPCSDPGFHNRYLCSSTRVTLAKKNMNPVSRRVTEFIHTLTAFAMSCQYFREALSFEDQLILLLNSWSRLLLLYMAESSFQFVITPLRSETIEGGSFGDPPDFCISPDEPTMKSVESVQSFIHKCQNMGVEQEEYFYLRLLVLFNSGKLLISVSTSVISVSYTCIV